MKKSATASTPYNADWQVLGELELPVGAGAGGAIQVWLAELLRPLAMHPDFQDRILASARDVAGRAFEGKDAVKREHIHLIIYVPRSDKSNAGTWGFFHVEKLEGTEEGESSPDHAVEFYLYLDGQ